MLKFVWKLLEVPFFQYVVYDQERDKRTKVFGRELSSRRGKFQTFGLAWRATLQFLSLVGHLDLPMRKTLRSVLGLLTIMILKRVSDSIFFQSNKFTACKVKDEKVVANSLMTFNLGKIIHSFQSKKHFRT